MLLRQDSTTTLELSAYAVDAMRVLMILERHADMSEAFDAQLRTACADWRNPGSIDQPADVIAMALFQVVHSLQQWHRETEQLLAGARSTPTNA